MRVDTLLRNLVLRLQRFEELFQRRELRGRNRLLLEVSKAHHAEVSVVIVSRVTTFVSKITRFPHATRGIDDVVVRDVLVRHARAWST